MINVYTVKKKELFQTQVHTKEEMETTSSANRRAWVDCIDLEESEKKLIADLIGVEIKTLSGIENGKTRPHYAKCLDEMCPFYTWIATPVVEFTDKLKLNPMSIIFKKRYLVTLRTKYSNSIIESVLRMFEALPPAERNPTLILSKLVHEIIDENSGAMVSIRDHIDKIEMEAMEGPWKKSVTRSIFRLKRNLSTLHRLLWAEKELLSDLDLGIIPNLKLVPEAKLIIEDAEDDITRELDFVDSFNRSLDSILRLQDLGSIHNVESKLMLLTWGLVLLTVVLVLIEVDIIGIIIESLG